MYVKLFQSIITSSIMEESVETRYVFIMLLALADAKGYVMGNDPALARQLNIDRDKFDAAIKRLMSPDPTSHSKAEGGRRLLLSDWCTGYFIVNYMRYRAIRDSEQRAEYMREYMRPRMRAKRAEASPVKQCLTNLAQAEAEGEEEAEVQHCVSSPVKTASEVLFYLNEKAGRQFRPTETNLKFIRARLEEPGVALAEVRKMIDRQVKRWKGTDMEEYLRPETLFNRTKFDNYYSARDLPLPPTSNPTPWMMKTRQDALQREIDAHPANRESAHFKVAHTPAQRSELAVLKQQHKELNRTLAGIPDPSATIEQHHSELKISQSNGNNNQSNGTTTNRAAEVEQLIDSLAKSKVR
jgi:uncharacterized phage protein (TIGR02220 family)